MNKPFANATNFTRTLPWNSIQTWIAILAAVFFLGLGIRAVLDPAGAAAFFGLPVPDEKGLAFVQVFGARNIGIALMGLALIILDVRIGVAVVFFSAALIAGLDFMIAMNAAGFAHAAKHIGYVVGLLAFGLWLVLRK